MFDSRAAYQVFMRVCGRFDCFRRAAISAIRYSCGTVPSESTPRDAMPTIVKTPSGTWKALVRKQGFPQVIKTFRLKRDAEDWARRAEDEMVRGAFVNRAPAR